MIGHVTLWLGPYDSTKIHSIWMTSQEITGEIKDLFCVNVRFYQTLH